MLKDMGPTHYTGWLEPVCENSLDCWAVPNAFPEAEGHLQVSGFMIIETQTM